MSFFFLNILGFCSKVVCTRCTVVVVVVIKNLSISVTSCLISFDLNFVFVFFDLPHASDMQSYVFPLDSNQERMLKRCASKFH